MSTIAIESGIRKIDARTAYPDVRYIYDFQICSEYEELGAALECINRCGYDLISVTQDQRGYYTVFFRRHPWE